MLRHVWHLQAGGNKEKQREQSKKIERNQAKAQQKGGGKGGKNKGMMVDDDSNDATAKPRKWNDYSVAFTFPDPPTVNNAQLLQLVDAHFKYPGREDFGMHDMNVGIGMGSRVRCTHALLAPRHQHTALWAACRTSRIL